MAVGPFLSVDAGFVELLSTKDFTSSSISMVLIPDSFTASIARAGMTYGDIKASEAAIIALPTPAVTLEGTNVRFTHAKGIFVESGTVSGRYVMYVYGVHDGPPADADKVFGYVDLTGAAEDAGSVNAEFSFTPHANGLFEVQRSAGS